MKNERYALALAILLVIPAGLLVKFGVGAPLHDWAYRYGGAILYEVLWVLVVRFVAPRVRPAAAGIGVFAVTCLLEVLQLWKPPWLQAVRATFIGRTLLGTTFDSFDFLYYAAGALLGSLLLRAIVARFGGTARPGPKRNSTAVR